MNNSEKYEDESLLASEYDDLLEIHQAIIVDDAEKLDELCQQGVKNLNGKFTDDLNPQHVNMTPLALSAALDKVELVKVLLKNGADVDATFASLKTTALMTSSFHGHASVVKLLLDKGANVRKTDVQKSTPLGYCFGGSRSEPVVSLLLEAGTDVNVSNVLGMNAFLLVSGYGNEKLLRMILNAGAKTREGAVNNFGHTPVHLCVLGKQSLVDAITGRGRRSTAHYGLQRRNVKTLLVDWSRENRDELLGGFAAGRSFEQVGQLMEDLGGRMTLMFKGGGNRRGSSNRRRRSSGASGEDDDDDDDDDEELWSEEEIMRRKIDVAAAYRREKLERTASHRKSGIIDSFLSCGGKLGSKQTKGSSRHKTDAPDTPAPVHEQPPPPLDDEDETKVKVLCGNFARSLRALVDAGCPVDESEFTFGLTALDVAILNGDVESTAILLSSGADGSHLMKVLALTDLYACLAADKLDKKKAKDLLDHDPHLDLNMSFENANIPTRLSESENDDMLGDVGLTPLSVVAKTQDPAAYDVIKLLIKHGANPNKVGKGGRTTLGEACRWGNVRMVDFLVSQGADLDQTNPAFNGANSLSVAVLEKQPKVVEYLISKGAAVDRVMTDGRTSLVHAMDAGNMALVETILKSNLISNFTDMGGFDYQVAQQYQSPGRDVRSIMESIKKKAVQLEEEEEKMKLEEKRLAEEVENRPSQSNKSQQQQQQQQRTRGYDEFDRANIYEEIGTTTTTTTMTNVAVMPKIRKKKKSSRSTADNSITSSGHYDLPGECPPETPQPTANHEPALSEMVAEPIYSEVKKPKKSASKKTSRQTRRSGQSPDVEEETGTGTGVSDEIFGSAKIEADDQQILSVRVKPEVRPRANGSIDRHLENPDDIAAIMESVTIGEGQPEVKTDERVVPAKRKKKVAREERPPEEEVAEAEVAQPEVPITMEGIDGVIVKPKARRRRTRPSTESTSNQDQHDDQLLLQQQQQQQLVLQRQQQEDGLRQQQMLLLLQQQQQQQQQQRDSNDAVFQSTEVKVKKKRSKKTPTVSKDEEEEAEEKGVGM